jgi:ABC-type amino acid transport substrate-binding protein
MTTVGYGDKAPKTGLGRLISVIWMFTAVVIISGFTASISAALTYNKLQDSITNIDDLRNFEVGTVKNSSSAEFLRDRRIDFEGFETLDVALEKLDEDKLSAVIYDKPLLTYLIHSKGYNESTEVLPSGVNSVYYSFSSRNDSLLKMINPLLIEVIETPDWNKVLSKYRLHEQ